MTKHMTSIPPKASIRDSIQEEWLPEPAEQQTRRNDGETRYRFETDDGSDVLTELQRAALRWLSSFD
jgi:hypothetical protein